MHDILDIRKKVTAKKGSYKSTLGTTSKHWLANHSETALIVVITALAVFIRYCGRQFLSADMEGCLLPWFDSIEGLGASALSTQVGNYNLPYQTLIYVGTLLPVSNPVYWYKGISIAFDFVLAAECYLLVKEVTGSAPKAAFCYSAALLLPPVFLNSGLWGQCDSIYGAFVIASTRRLLNGRPAYASFLFGVALSFKLQAIFFLPFFVYWLLKCRTFSVRFLAAALLGFYLPCLPAVLGGRSPFDPFAVYVSQTGYYARMYMNYPSFWVMVGDNYSALKSIAIAFTMAMLAIEMYLLLNADRATSPFGFLLAAAWMSLTCVYYLPAMHERYGYAVTVLLVTIAASSENPARYLPPALICVVSDLLVYSNYLFDASVPLLPLSVAMLLAWLWLGWLILGREVTPASGLPGRAAQDRSEDASR